MQETAYESFPEAFSTRDLARATRCSLAEVEAWVEAGAIRTLPTGDGQTWMSRSEALRVGRSLLEGTMALSLHPTEGDPAKLFESDKPASWRGIRAPLAVSSALHAGIVVAIVLITTLGFGQVKATTDALVDAQPMRLVFLAIPGPGGGGGGGGVRQILKPPKAERKGKAPLDSPLPRRTPPPPARVPDPPKPLPELEPLPPVVAPVVEVPANKQDHVGLPEPSTVVADSRGPGDKGGVGTGEGTGLGSGEGTGIGDGEGGGVGGGPYRPGSGVAPPTLVREVRPDYTEEARRRGVRGDVVMEIVVRRNGTVGEVRVLEGLGYGLDERAVAAVRQWTFNPATRHGTPVDVMVEVAMEFKLR